MPSNITPKNTAGWKKFEWRALRPRACQVVGLSSVPGTRHSGRSAGKLDPPHLNLEHDRLLHEYNSAVVELSRTVQALATVAGTSKAKDYKYATAKKREPRRDFRRPGMPTCGTLPNTDAPTRGSWLECPDGP
jgi:hypothetical protein